LSFLIYFTGYAPAETYPLEHITSIPSPEPFALSPKLLALRSAP